MLFWFSINFCLLENLRHNVHSFILANHWNNFTLVRKFDQVIESRVWSRILICAFLWTPLGSTFSSGYLHGLSGACFPFSEFILRFQRSLSFS